MINSLISRLQRVEVNYRRFGLMNTIKYLVKNAIVKRPLNQINYYSAGSASQKMTKENLLRSVVNDLKINSKNCLVLEDSPMGAIAAKKNFMKVIIINTSNLPKNDFNVNLLIDDYTSPELFSFLAKASNHGT